MGKLSIIAPVGGGQGGVEDRGTKGTYHIHRYVLGVDMSGGTENSREFAPAGIPPSLRKFTVVHNAVSYYHLQSQANNGVSEPPFDPRSLETEIRRTSVYPQTLVRCPVSASCTISSLLSIYLIFASNSSCSDNFRRL